MQAVTNCCIIPNMCKVPHAVHVCFRFAGQIAFELSFLPWETCFAV